MDTSLCSPLPRLSAKTSIIKLSDLPDNFIIDVLADSLGRGEQREVSMQCHKIDFPGRTLDSTPDTNIYGPTREIVNGFSFAEISASFYQSNNYQEKQFFETWQRLAYDPNSWSIQYYDDYVGKIEIYSLDNDGARRYGVQLVECFPKTISAQNLDANPSSTCLLYTSDAADDA